MWTRSRTEPEPRRTPVTVTDARRGRQPGRAIPSLERTQVRQTGLNSAPTWKRRAFWRLRERKFVPPEPTGGASTASSNAASQMAQRSNSPELAEGPKRTLRPAPDVDRLTGNEAGFVAAEKSDHARDVFGLPDPAQGDLRRRAELERLVIHPHPLRGGSRHAGLHEPRCHRVDVDV